MSERARYVTEQVKLWVANDSQYYYAAVSVAAREGSQKLAAYLAHHLRTAVVYSAAWQVAQELSPNDYDRIRWVEVQNELLGE